MLGKHKGLIPVLFKDQQLDPYQIKEEKYLK